MRLEEAEICEASLRTPLKIHHQFLTFLIHLLIKCVYYPLSAFSVVIRFLAVDISSLDHYDNNPTLCSIPILPLSSHLALLSLPE